MEQYIVSARKYRPTTFDSVVGQQALAGTLKNAISTGRLAHAYLFCGSRGVGKTSCARIFAKTINCTNRTAAGEACNECDSCRQFNENRSLNIIELDAASNNGVDDIRALIEQVAVPPTQGRYRVFIIDEVHMLSNAAFNSFLKTLEEPPAYVIFILATTEKHKIIPTILSRCQIYDFNRISINDMVSHMQRVAANEGITAEPEALNVIARKADGAMRDALSIFDQVAASTNGNISYAATIENLNVLDQSYYNRLLDAFVAQDIAQALLIYKEIRDQGFDSQFFVNGLASYLRDLAVAQNPSTLNLLEATDDVRQEMAARASKLHPTFLYRAMDLCNEADFNFRAASNKQFLVELTLIRLCQLLSPSTDDVGAGGGQLQPLENYTTSVAPQEAAPVAAPVAATAPKPVVTSPLPQPSAPQPRATYAPGGMSLAEVARRARNTSHNHTDNSNKKEADGRRAQQYTDADIASAWASLAANMNADRVLASVMGNITPIHVEGDRYLLRCASQLVADMVEKHIDTISASIRDSVSNDNICFETEISDVDLPKTMWTDDRVLEELIKEHPAIDEMIKKFQLRRI
ncbi:MAG: DNA polymerase III subunit gamma/tau [Muribaculaceae bacterium]|nr:DNA polymerase III subunit gamma/tau [Muribaculaceae bacterium]